MFKILSWVLVSALVALIAWQGLANKKDIPSARVDADVSLSQAVPEMNVEIPTNAVEAPVIVEPEPAEVADSSHKLTLKPETIEQSMEGIERFFDEAQVTEAMPDLEQPLLDESLLDEQTEEVSVDVAPYVPPEKRTAGNLGGPPSAEMVFASPGKAL